MTCGFLPMGLCMIHPLTAGTAEPGSHQDGLRRHVFPVDPLPRGFAPSSQLRGRARVSSNDLSVQGRAWLLFEDRQHTGKVGLLYRLRRFPTVIPSLNKPAKLPIFVLGLALTEVPSMTPKSRPTLQEQRTAGTSNPVQESLYQDAPDVAG